MKAVIFDYYFTLAQPALTDFALLAKTLGCRVDPEEIETSRRDLLANRPLLTPAFDGPPERFQSFYTYWVEYGDALFGGLGVDGGGAAYAAIRRDAHETASLYPDVAPALGWLRDAGLRTGVLSDADRDHLTASMARCGLSFDHVVCSEDLSCYKPHRSCFEAVCARVGVDPNDAVYVGDSPLADIDGSRRAGLRPVWLNRSGVEWPDELVPPKLAARSLDDLPRLLA